MAALFCLWVSAFTFLCGIAYLALGYEVAVGWVQLFLGALCLALTIRWRYLSQKETEASAPKQP